MNKHNERGMFSLLVHADFFVFAFLPGGGGGGSKYRTTGYSSYEWK